jgi:hypothetical protein
VTLGTLSAWAAASTDNNAAADAATIKNIAKAPLRPWAASRAMISCSAGLRRRRMLSMSPWPALRQCSAGAEPVVQARTLAAG